MHQFSESQTKALWSAIILRIVIFIRICMVNRQDMPTQLICHTKPYNNRNFHIDGTSRYFGVWLWQLVHLLILVCSFQWSVLFLYLAKLYRSCPIRDKSLLCCYMWDLRLLSISDHPGHANPNPWVFTVPCSSCSTSFDIQALSTDSGINPNAWTTGTEGRTSEKNWCVGRTFLLWKEIWGWLCDL